MDYNTVANLEACRAAVEEVANLLYYSHIPTAVVAFLMGFFVFIKDSKSLVSRNLFFVTIFFGVWSSLDLFIWLNYDKNTLVMLAWSFLGLVSTLIFMFGFYFVYVFFDKKDIPFNKKIFFSLPLLPIILLTPTRFNLTSFDTVNCVAIEGSLFTNYYYLLGLVFLISILILSILRYLKATSRKTRVEIIFVTIGIASFLFSFLFATYSASFLTSLGLDQYMLEQYGLFGMPVFIGFLAYLIVRYQAFNIKVIATQALVVTLAILIGSQLFFIKSQINFILTSITFLLSVLFGSILIRSVKNEIRRKEELQIVTDKLAAANVELKRLDQSKTEFISIASHQLRTPLTAIKGFVSLLLEGSYGAVPASIADVLDKIYTANDRIVHLVEDLLNISRMESGRLKYEYAEVTIPEFLNELRDTFALVAKKKGLDLTFEVPAGALAPAWIDRQKAFEVVSNLIDNAIKYTSTGSVRVRAEGVLGFVRISVADTGVGIDPDMMPVLFQKFSRGKESGKMHVSGTGLGLYVGKSMIEAQGGHIGVISEGRDKGSTFFVELPVKQG